MHTNHKKQAESQKHENSRFREEIHSEVVRAGKRTYFFDVKATRGNQLYLTITESKKTVNDRGETNYEKHKIFLYPEDFDKFTEGLSGVIDYINRKQPQTNDLAINEKVENSVDKYVTVDFDDL